MSVVVLGMEMPERCGKCDFWNEITFCAVTGANIREFIEKRTRADDCPLRPIPKGHGRIVDVGPLEVVAYNEKDHAGEDFGDGVIYILEKLDALPTIVEEVEKGER